MRVAFVITRADAIGGANVHVRDLAQALRDDGHEAVVLVGGRGPFLDQLARRGIPFETLRWLTREVAPHRDVAAAWELAAALRRVRPDVLSLHTAKAGAIGRLVAPSLGLRPLYTPHGWSFADGVGRRSAAAYRWAERVLALLPATLVNVCEADRALALRHGVGGPRAHLVVHNGMPDVDPRLRADPGAEPARLVMVARFEAQKDHATLLRALAGLTHRPGWSLALVGDGPGAAAARAAVAQLGLAGRVDFVGAVDDAAPHLAAAQAFVLATRWEGFPRSILEAMRAGLPVVATRVAGVAEAVAHGETGLLVERGDVAGLASAIGALLDDPARRRAYGAAGRARYEEAFTFAGMWTRYRELYLARAAEAARRV